MRPSVDNGALHPSCEQVSGYALVRRLGRGGVAEVWEAESPSGYRVALKLIHLTSDLRSGELRALKITRGIRHPYLLMNFGTWQIGSLLVISMELADRTLWDRYLEANAQGLRGFPRAELLGYLACVADAVDYLNGYWHSVGGRQGVGIQHRDLKPQNILLVGTCPKVADFGLARVMEEKVAPHTGPCTLPYAAPEYFSGQTTHQSDQYALAVTYCQLRGGRMPFPGTLAQIAFGHLNSDPDLDGLPGPERPAVARALAKKPEDRWPDCRSFIEALLSVESAPGDPIPDSLPRTPGDVPNDDDREESRDDFADPHAWAGDSDFIPTDSGEPDLLLDTCEGASQPAGSRAATVGLARASTTPQSVGADPEGLTFASGRPTVGNEAAPRAASPAVGFRPGWTRLAQLAAMVALTLALSMRGVRSPTNPPHPLVSSRVATVSMHAPRQQPVDESITPGPGEGPAASTPDVAAEERGNASVAMVPRPDGGPSGVVPAPRAETPRGEEAASAIEPTPGPSIELVAPTPVGAGSEPRRAEPALSVEAPRLANFDPPPPSASERDAPRLRLANRTREIPGPASPPASGGDGGVAEGPPVGSMEGRTSVATPHATAMAAHEQGREDFSRHLYDRAVAAFTEAIRLAPGSFEAHHYRGVAYHLQRRHREALADYTAAIRLRPGDADAYRVRAMLYNDLGKKDLALADYSEFIRLRPDEKAYLARGTLHHELGDYGRALADFDVALKLRPEDLLARYRRGLTRYVAGDLPRAIEDFTQVILLDPRHFGAYRHRAEAYARIGQLDRAAADHDAYERLVRPSGKSVLR